MVYDHPSNWSIHSTCALKTISINANCIVDETMCEGWIWRRRRRREREIY
jgi:hypothetical protein